MLLILFPSHLSAQDDCSIYEVKSLHFNSDLYLKLENALINDHKSMLEELRVGFSSFDLDYITFEVEIHVVNGTNVTCDDRGRWYRHPSFCPARNDTSEYEWELCHKSEINFNVPHASELKSEYAVYEISRFLVWAVSIHRGSILSLTLIALVVAGHINNVYPQSKFDANDGSMFIKLTIDRLDCNPESDRLECDISELLSWVGSSFTHTLHNNYNNYAWRVWYLCSLH